MTTTKEKKQIILELLQLILSIIALYYMDSQFHRYLLYCIPIVIIIIIITGIQFYMNERAKKKETSINMSLWNIVAIFMIVPPLLVFLFKDFRLWFEYWEHTFFNFPVVKIPFAGLCIWCFIFVFYALKRYLKNDFYVYILTLLIVTGLFLLLWLI